MPVTQEPEETDTDLKVDCVKEPVDPSTVAKGEKRTNHD